VARYSDTELLEFKDRIVELMDTDAGVGITGVGPRYQTNRVGVQLNEVVERTLAEISAVALRTSWRSRFDSGINGGCDGVIGHASVPERH